MSFGGRGRCSILPEDVQAVADDDDFHNVSLTPSVALYVFVQPDEREDNVSYYRGQAHVWLKDSVFEGSSRVRHARELLILGNAIGDDLRGFAMIYSDGGHDHNVSFYNFIMSWLAYFTLSGHDILIVARTAPTQSWTNLAEHVMSVLNLAMQ